MKPVLEVADIFRHHGDAYRQAHGDHMGRVEHRILSAIAACRTAVLGGHVEQCTDCGEKRISYNSCRNRHCPKCQNLARAEWLEARKAELLPVPYFHVVFTLPAPLTEIAFQNKAVVYDLLMRAAADTLRTMAADREHLGADIGLIAVLHTWGQNLHHHPHVHCIVPGGGLSADGAKWVASRPDFLLDVKVLSVLFRNRFINEITAAFKAGRLQFFAALAAARRSRHLRAPPGPAERCGLGCVRQASFRRSRGDARLSRALHPSRGDHQQPAHQPRARPRQLSLEGLSAGWRDQTHDVSAPRSSSAGFCCMPYRMGSSASGTMVCSPMAIVPRSLNSAERCSQRRHRPQGRQRAITASNIANSQETISISAHTAVGAWCALAHCPHHSHTAMLHIGATPLELRSRLDTGPAAQTHRHIRR